MFPTGMRSDGQRLGKSSTCRTYLVRAVKIGLGMIVFEIVHARR